MQLGSELITHCLSRIFGNFSVLFKLSFVYKPTVEEEVGNEIVMGGRQEMKLEK